MLLRSYRPADLEMLYQIDQQCFPPGVSYSRQEIESFVRQRSSRTWIAENEGQIAGFLIATPRPPRLAHVITIDILERWRRRGIGTALMEAAEAWARAALAGMMLLETAEDNLAAQAFYEARGYRRIERIENYYANGAAAWVMAKRLAKPQRPLT